MRQDPTVVGNLKTEVGVRFAPDKRCHQHPFGRNTRHDSTALLGSVVSAIQDVLLYICVSGNLEGIEARKLFRQSNRHPGPTIPNFRTTETEWIAQPGRLSSLS